jgi:alkylated DNA repair dioxygenase AlkB
MVPPGERRLADGRGGMLFDVNEQPAPGEEVCVDPDAVTGRLHLDDTSWVDVVRGWLLGADTLKSLLLENVPWESSRLFRYDHWVEERRLVAVWRPGTPLPHPALAPLHRALERRYDVRFPGFSLVQYRDGRDGQAFHRDTDMRWLDDTVIAVLTLGARRPWLLRPRSHRYDHSESRGATHDLAPGAGDLLVMGGRCQADWEHSVPYRPRERVGSRVAIQWRYAARRGRPFAGSSYRAPLTYNS